HAIDVPKSVQFFSFAIEDLDDVHSGDVLLQEGSHCSKPLAHASEAWPEYGPEPHAESNHSEQHKTGDQGQKPVKPEHPNQRIERHDYFAEQDCDTDIQYLVNSLDINGQSGEQMACRILVKKFH